MASFFLREKIATDAFPKEDRPEESSRLSQCHLSEVWAHH
jgi:hypothetical protein